MSTASITCRRRSADDSAPAWAPTGPTEPDHKQAAPSLLGLPSPRLPARRFGIAGTPLVFAGALHLLAAALLAMWSRPTGFLTSIDEPAQPPAYQLQLPAHLVFVPNNIPGGGGGGGGNRQSGPIRRAEGIGNDTATLRTGPPRRETTSVDVERDIPAIVLDAQPLAAGASNQIGLPVGGVSYGTSTGPGSGGGVGTGTGTGVGSGKGPGLGPGSGGGFGGGAYRPGGAVTAPRVRSHVNPRYTTDALERKLEGSVWLELVVTAEGRAGAIRVVQSIALAGSTKKQSRPSATGISSPEGSRAAPSTWW